MKTVDDKLVDDYCDLLIREELAKGYTDYDSAVLGSLKGLLSYSLSNPGTVVAYMRERIDASRV